MALGSSAPEILLSVIETTKDLDATPGELGPSTIVGSAAFNLLVISGLSILAVGDEPKKIYDTGVFAVTSIASLFAYVWLYLVLQDCTMEKNVVTIAEGWLTLSYFFILVIAAFAADKINAWLEDQRKTTRDVEEENKAQEIQIKKNQLRKHAKEIGQTQVIEIAQGHSSKETGKIPQSSQQEIRELFKSILEEDPVEVDIQRLLTILQPDSLLERFAYRKQGGMGGNKEFIKLKGAKGQIDHSVTQGKVEIENEIVGFKCLHYSVTESNGHVEVTIVKKAPQELTIGVRTVADTAISPKDFTHFDDVITMTKRETEKKVQIAIIDDDEWEPDLDFFVELYDPNKEEKNDRLIGDDTRCKVTILDEDFPGTLGFDKTEIKAHKSREKVDIYVTRSDGSDGTINCMIKTEPLTEVVSNMNAVEFEDYCPKHEKVVFGHGETEKCITIQLVNNKGPEEEMPLKKGEEPEVEGEEEED